MPASTSTGAHPRAWGRLLSFRGWVWLLACIPFSAAVWALLIRFFL